jgi:hypothetical protein
MTETSQAAPGGIDLTGVIQERLDSALADGKPIAVSYVDLAGRPHLSLRGSTHVHSPDQLAIWVRKAQGGIAEAVIDNPNVVFLYRNSDTRTTYILSGTARVDDDEAVRWAVYDASPEPERDHDPDHHGVALVVDLERVQGNTVGGTRVSMVRAS